MEIKAVQLVGQRLDMTRADGVYNYTVKAEWRLLGTVFDRQVPLPEEDIALLRLRFEWEPCSRLDLTYPEDATGGSPSISAVGMAAMQWLGAEYAARAAAWIGKEPTTELVVVTPPAAEEVTP